ncbi:MAG: aspartyl protease family protein, partial [Chitinophagaceae bacterium]|nr:aspartyl protease family protein [Chitinophagaceae bacterium]
TAARLQLKLTPSDRTIKGIAGIKTVDYARDHTLQLPGLSVSQLDFHINDYELLTGVYGMKIDGIIGFSFLRRYLVTLDYEKKMMRVYTPGDMKYPRGGHLLRPAIVGLPMQYAVVADEHSIMGRFFLDTGAGLNLLLNNAFVNDSALLPRDKRRYPTVAEGLGGKKEMEMAVLKRFKLGPYKFRKVPVYLFDDEFNVTSYPHLGGLIGNDILRRFNVILNYPKSEIHLLPNSHYRDPFDYSYTGLGLYSANGVIVVTDVLAGSPAEQAGIKVGDIVFAVDNNLSGNMQTYRNILMQSGRKIKLVMRRDQELVQTTLVIRTIK